MPYKHSERVVDELKQIAADETAIFWRRIYRSYARLYPAKNIADAVLDVPCLRIRWDGDGYMSHPLLLCWEKGKWDWHPMRTHVKPKGTVLKSIE